jgi:hypothetical protein
MTIISVVKTVAQYENFAESGLKVNDQFKRVYEINKNISYSLTYIEYLTCKIKEEGNYVIKSQLYKSYIITGMAIIECIFHYLIKSKELNKTIQYREISKIKSNSKVILGKEIRVETILSEKLQTPQEDGMTLDKMIKIAEKYKLLGHNQQETYSRLARLRKLRNKIHLHISDYLEHDYNSFTRREAIIMREILKVVIYSDIFKNHQNKEELFDYIK